VWANRSWIEKMKLDYSTIKGQSLIKYLDNKTLEEFQRVMPELNKGNAIKDLDCTFISAEGENLHLIGRAIPLLKNGEMTGSQAYLHDITQIKKAEEELRNLLHLTQRQNDRLKNFAHIVSHNIRSHSANLSGLVRELSEIDNEEERLMFTQLIKAGTEKLNETIFNLNEIVTINENSNISLIPKSLYIEIEKTLSVVANNIIQNNITIENNVRADIEVMVVSSYLESIVLNLITNAIKYRDSNKNAFIRINAEKNGPLVRLCVEDNGLGIDLKRYGSKLFGMYKTFHKHPDARGVGLFITKAQIEAMGGKIEVESETGIGTRFFVHLIVAD
jgi:signal transduction histidine kinase